MTELELSLKDTLFSGQCFRVKEENGVFNVCSGVDSEVKSLSLTQGELFKIEEDHYWSNFFDLDTDYESMKKRFSEVSPIMAEACSYAPGIRILNQNSWEALCSFVVSQNNNIKRIMGIIEKICISFGKTGQGGIHGFPSAETLASASDEKLRGCGLGFRAPYIINTAQAVCTGRINLEELKSLPVESAEKLLTSIKGIGPKVASCALLFGCHRLDCFPMDVWMKRAMATWFPGKDSSVFGENAGVAQQYIFHYARTGGKDDF